MTKKIISITQNGQFQRLYRRGSSAVMPTMVIYLSRNRGKENRLGLTAGKKIGGAVQRNRAKRRLRELFRISQDRLCQGYDFCMVARGCTAQAPYARLRRDFRAAAVKLGVWKDAEAAD